MYKLREFYWRIICGYLFLIDGHGVESLFKIITDVKTFYFAAQVNSIVPLQFNEELFNQTTDKFLTLHAVDANL